MFPSKLFLFTLLGLFLSTKANQHQEFYNFASQSMTYLLDTDADALEKVREEIKSTFLRESVSETLQDALIELYTTDLDELDLNKDLDQNELAARLEAGKKALFVEHKAELLEFKHEGLFEDLEDLYMRYLLSYTNLLVKQNKAIRANDSQAGLQYHIDIDMNIKGLLQNYIYDDLNIQTNEEFMKSQQTDKQDKKNVRFAAFQKFFEDGEQMDVADNNLIKKVQEQVNDRLGVAQLRVDHAYNYATKVLALMYKMTNTIEGYTFNMDDYPKVIMRISEISYAFYTCTQDLPLGDPRQLVLMSNIKHEKKHAQLFNNENQPATVLYSYLAGAVMKMAHSVNPGLTQKHMTYLLSTNLMNSTTMAPFMKNIYDKYSSETWANWNDQEDEDKEVNAIMMVETFNYVNSEGIKFSAEDYDNFVDHMAELLNANQAVLAYNIVFVLFSLKQCPTEENINLDMNYTLYKYLLEFRYTEAENLLNPENVDSEWSIEFDKYLDARYKAESETEDAKVLSYYPYMKLLTVIKMASIGMEEEVVTIANLSQNVIDQLVANQHKLDANQPTVCEPLNNHINNIVRLFDVNIKKGDFNGALARLSGLVIKVKSLLEIFRFDQKSKSVNIENDKIELPNYNFSAKVFAGNFKKKILEMEKTRDEQDKLRNKKGNSRSEESWVEPTDVEEVIINNQNPHTQSGETGVLDFQKDLSSEEEIPKKEPKVDPDQKLSDLGEQVFFGDVKKNNQIITPSEQSNEISEESAESKNLSIKDTKNRPTGKLSTTSFKTDSESAEKEDPNNKKFNNKGKNSKSESSEDFSEEDDNNRVVELNNPENLVEVVSGGDLTRQEMDILKNPKVMENLKNMENGENKIVFENADGSLTEIIYVQVVPYKSPCYDEIKLLE